MGIFEPCCFPIRLLITSNSGRISMLSAALCLSYAWLPSALWDWRYKAVTKLNICGTCGKWKWTWFIYSCISHPEVICLVYLICDSNVWFLRSRTLKTVALVFLLYKNSSTIIADRNFPVWSSKKDSISCEWILTSLIWVHKLFIALYSRWYCSNEPITCISPGQCLNLHFQHSRQDQ